MREKERERDISEKSGRSVEVETKYRKLLQQYALECEYIAPHFALSNIEFNCRKLLRIPI